MIKNKIVVFGCNHQNMLGLVRSLGEKGIRPYCVLLKSKDGLVFRSKYPALCHFAESPEAGYQYIIEQFSNETIKPILLSSDDVTETLFDKNATALREHFIVPASDVDGKLTYLMEKMHIGELARQYGFITPKMIVLKKGQDLPNDMHFPVFTKSVKSIDGGKKEEQVCYTAKELDNILNVCRAKELLVQEYIDKKTEYCIQGFTVNGFVYIPYYMQYLRFSNNAFGGYTLHSIMTDKLFSTKIIEFIKGISFNGLFSVEFLVDKNNQLFFTEVNFRHDGACYHTTKGGANLPYLYCLKVIGEDLPQVDLKQNVVGMDEFKDLKQSVKTGKISKLKWLYQFVTADSHKLFNKKDMGPIWYMIKKLL